MSGLPESAVIWHMAHIVGARYRPPAEAILKVLPTDYILELRPEPDNPHDANAIQVWTNVSALSDEAKKQLDTFAQGYGYDLPIILERGEWMLGFISKTEAAIMAPMLLTSVVAIAQLAFNAEGRPKVKFQLTEKAPEYD